MAKNAELNFKIDKSTIVYSSITKEGAYNHARVVSKMADKTYMIVSFEWEGSDIPDYVMDLMSTMSASELKPNKVVAGREEDYAEYCAINLK